MIEYHDTEWGVPVHDDQKLYEFMVLDAFQAGLSWAIILSKREGFKKAFSGFDPEKVALYDQDKINELILDPGIIRNKMKINAAVNNARAFLEVKAEFGSFDKFIWQFTGGKTLVNCWESIKEVPARSVESDNMSRELKKRGFKFVGSTICYAFMQAAGMINDHLTGCFRYNSVSSPS
jgi:DNA-3-methyladenine glycosylase I